MHLMVNTGQKLNGSTTLMPLPSGHTVHLPDGSTMSCGAPAIRTAVPPWMAGGPDAQYIRANFLTRPFSSMGDSREAPAPATTRPTAADGAGA